MFVRSYWYSAESPNCDRPIIDLWGCLVGGSVKGRETIVRHSLSIINKAIDDKLPWQMGKNNEYTFKI